MQLKANNALMPLIFIFVSMVFSMQLNADDGTKEYIGPQLLFSPPEFLSVESLEVLASDKEVTVEYVIKNNSKDDWSSEMIFNIPERPWYEYVIWYSNRGFSDLVVKVNDRPLKYKDQAIAYLDGVDVSRKLAEAGLDPNLVDLDEFELAEIFPELTPETIQKFKALEDDELIYLYLEPVTTNEKLWFQPRWSTANIYNWSQVFPAGETTKISYSYKPLPGVDRFSVEYSDINPYFLSLSGYKSIEALITEACTSLPEISQWKPTTSGYYAFEWFTFPLSSIDWARPIGSFSLQVDGRKNENFNHEKLSLSCINGQKFIGHPKMDAKMENLTIDKPMVLLRFWPL